MKKIFIMIMLVCTFGISSTLVAQELTPEKGDWALGTDVIPLLNSLGKVFSNNTNATGFGGSPSWFNNSNNIVRPDVSIMGKYMLTSKIAVRANIGVNFINSTTKTQVDDFAAQQIDPQSQAKLFDKTSAKQNGFNLALGGEYRIGKKRVQGVFGADLLLGYYSLVAKNTYGNQLSSLYLGQNDATTHTANSSTSARPLQSKTADIFQIGANVSAGIEVFVAPKIALGGQVNLSYVANIGGKIHTTGEYFDANTQSVKEWTNIQGFTATTQSFSTNNLGGALYMIFYFNRK